MKVLLAGKDFYIWHKNLIEALVKCKVLECYEDPYLPSNEAFILDKKDVTFNYKPIEYDTLSRSFIEPFNRGFGILIRLTS